jgi:hypothetical protein
VHLIGTGSRCDLAIINIELRSWISFIVGAFHGDQFIRFKSHTLTVRSFIRFVKMRSILYLAAAALPLTQGVRIIQSNDDGWSEANLRYGLKDVKSQALLTSIEPSLMS